MAYDLFGAACPDPGLAFNEAGVEIMSPHYSTLRDGNPTTIPADYLPPDYQPPAHRIRTLDA